MQIAPYSRPVLSQIPYEWNVQSVVSTELDSHSWTLNFCSYIFTPILSVIIIFLSFLFGGSQGVLLLLVASIPTILMLACLCLCYERCISEKLMIEMFWLGVFVSVPIAFILECYGEALSFKSLACLPQFPNKEVNNNTNVILNLYENSFVFKSKQEIGKKESCASLNLFNNYYHKYHILNVLNSSEIKIVSKDHTSYENNYRTAEEESTVDKNPALHDPPTFFCCLKVFIWMIFIVGFVEEFSKFILLLRIKLSDSFIPFACKWWWRRVDSPCAFCLAGCAAAAGFAVCENVKYTLTISSSFQDGFLIAIERTLLAIPFHICSTSLIASRMIKFCKASLSTTNLSSPNPTILTDNLGNQFLPQHANHENVNIQRSNDAVVSQSMLNAQYAYILEKASLSNYFSFMWFNVLMHGLYDAGLTVSSSFAYTEKLELALLFVSLSFFSWITVISLFIYEFKKLPVLNFH